MARERILGIPFFTGSVEEAVAESWRGCPVEMPARSPRAVRMLDRMGDRE